MSEEKRLRVQIVSPDGVLWEGDSSFTVLPAFDGELGIHPDHAPLLARLGIGEARIHTEDGVHYFALFGGFLEVLADRVQVIVDRAEAPEAIDAQEARNEIDRLRGLERRDVTLHEEELELCRIAQARIKVAGRKS
jgi:F-type H+-transporting ATPase subunit epsilon